MFMLSKTRDIPASTNSFFPSVFSNPDWPLNPWISMLASDFKRNIFPSDLQEIDDQYILTVEAPGIKKDKLSIKFTESNKILTISECSEDISENSNDNYIWKERKLELYSRNFKFPSNIDIDSLTAEMEDGIITIKVNKIDKLPIAEREIIIK